ncbi:RICIN domain-containing protein [Streptomyces sp. NPDC049949]|uniref:RICIN domain-containing protein n=1 Tax=Streptomyces sp. NPDC049949 TaxID=3154627 RepID=UPI0034486803
MLGIRRRPPGNARRYVHTALATSLAAVAALLLGGAASPPAAADTARSAPVPVRLDPAYQHAPFEGWGTALAWFANVTGGWPDAQRNRLAYGTGGLGLTIARYNIGGGDSKETAPYMRAGAAVPGHWNPAGAQAPDDCGWGDSQRWRFETLADGYVRIVAKHSSKCLAVRGGSTTAGARIVQSVCDGSPGQAWKVSAAGPADPTDPTDPPAPGTAERQLTTSVGAGVPTMATTAEPVRLPPVDFGTGGTSAGQLGTVTVKDFRGGTAGWSLTGKVTDFTGPRGKIEANRLAWTPVCSTRSDSPSTCAAGSTGVVGKDGATLASAAGGVTGGEFAADATVSLDIPKYTPVGSYTDVLSLTLL